MNRLEAIDLVQKAIAICAVRDMPQTQASMTELLFLLQADRHDVAVSNRPQRVLH